MSSVFYHNDDPLLRQQPPISLFHSTNGQGANNANLSDAYAQIYKQQLMLELQQQQQQNSSNGVAKDWVGELDAKMKELDSSTADLLVQDKEFSELNSQLQSFIQSEIMNLVKLKINTNQNAVENIKRQLEIMNTSSKKVKEEEKQNMSELNDYIKNYSNLTFDEYKKLKYGGAKTTESNQVIITS